MYSGFPPQSKVMPPGGGRRGVRVIGDSTLPVMLELFVSAEPIGGTPSLARC